MSWLVSLSKFDIPAPREMSETAGSRAQDWMAKWQRHVVPYRPGTTVEIHAAEHRDMAEGLALDEPTEPDFEDFWEMAARLNAALTQFEDADTWLTFDAEKSFAVNVATGRECLVASLGPDVRHYGPQPSRSKHEWYLGDHPQDRLASNYLEYQTFYRHAGREVRLCDADHGPNGVVTTLRQWHAQGVRDFVVKTRAAKYGVFFLHVTDDQDPATSDSDLGWALVHMDEQPASFLVQHKVSMTYEYRVFVVDSRPVTGAGCIESMTPLENEATFDPKMAAVRGQDAVESLPEQVLRYRAFAESFAAEMAVEQPELTDYVLDLAVGADGQVLVIELNGILNSGLYASDPELVTQAMNEQAFAGHEGAPAS